MSTRRFLIRFRENNSEEKNIWQWVESVPNGKRSREIIRLLKRGMETEQLEELLRRVIREELEGVSAVKQNSAPDEKEPDIPDKMMGFLDEFLSE